MKEEMLHIHSASESLSGGIFEPSDGTVPDTKCKENSLTSSTAWTTPLDTELRDKATLKIHVMTELLPGAPVSQASGSLPAPSLPAPGILHLGLDFSILSPPSPPLPPSGLISAHFPRTPPLCLVLLHSLTVLCDTYVYM